MNTEPTMLLEMALNYMNWMSAARTAGTNAEWRHALWQADLIHFRWRLLRNRKVYQ